MANMLYIFNGYTDMHPFQFTIVDRTLDCARWRLMSVAQTDNYHEFKGCYAESVKDVCKGGIAFTSDATGKFVEKKTSTEFVFDSKVTIKAYTPIMFSSCLDG